MGLHVGAFTSSIRSVNSVNTSNFYPLSEGAVQSLPIRPSINFLQRTTNIKTSKKSHVIIGSCRVIFSLSLSNKSYINKHFFEAFHVFCGTLGVNRKLDNIFKFRLFSHAWGLRGDMQFFSSQFSWFIHILSLLSRLTTKNASHRKLQISYSQLGSNNNKHAYVVVVEHIEREFWYSGLILVILSNLFCGF